MSDAHRKKKNPDQVRAALLAAARGLAIQHGVVAVSVQSVSTAAGVTKGAFFNHFATKQGLIDALIAELMTAMDAEIDRHMVADPQRMGSFTRAYVETTFAENEDGDDWSPLWMSMVADPQLRADWSTWFEARLERHKDTDSGLSLESVRFTADGYWLGRIVGIHPRNREALRDHLVELTRAPPQDAPATAGIGEIDPG